MPSILTGRDVSFELPNRRRLLENLNFTLTNSKTALVGPNGIGKTILANLLSGRLEPTTGSIRRNGGIVLFQQRETPPTTPVEDFLLNDYTWSLFGEKLLAGVDRKALCNTLSGGQWMRVRLANVLQDNYLILDEPTNDLDRDGRQALIDFLRECRHGFLLISHDRECLRICEEILELSNRGLAKFGMGWTAYCEARAKERSSLEGALVSARQEREKSIANRAELQARQDKKNRHGANEAAKGGIPKILLGARKRTAEVSTGKIDSETAERANAAVRDIHESLKELKVDPLIYADLLGEALPSQKLVAEAEHFNVHYSRWTYEQDLTFSWRGNIRIAIKGKNGAGKSTLMKALLGHSFETRGILRTGKLQTLYIDQRCASLLDQKSILENVRAVSTLSESEIRSGLAKFLFTKDSVFQKVHELSGGERLRAALACGFLQSAKPELLLLDEPTNNLDLPNVEFLERLIHEFQGAVLVVSHDEDFLKNCGVTEVLVV